MVPHSPYRLMLAGQTLCVEVAKTGEEKAKGLMFRRKLESNAGMLFVFKKPTTNGFWMKNTSIPLDIGFFDYHKALLEIRTMKPYSHTIQRPKQPYVYALEVNQGWFLTHQIKRGDKFTLVKLPCLKRPE
jgi:hypothetical protein